MFVHGRIQEFEKGGQMASEEREPITGSIYCPQWSPGARGSGGFAP